MNNNVKVRIYELSKELNLDNKDILAVCERLNIAVKSHSSTITESDAQRIEKYVATHPVTNHHDSQSERGGHQSKLSDSQAEQKKKQQILEVRKPKLQANSNSQRFSTQERNSASVPTATQPQPSVPSSLSSEKPTLLERPVLSKPNSASQSPSESISQPEAEASWDDNNPPIQQPTEISVSEPSEPDSAELDSPEEAPQLVSPPVRPSAQSSQPAVVKNKPVLKSNKPASKSAEVQQQPAAKTTTTDKPAPKPTKNPRPGSSESRSADSKETKEREVRKPRKEITSLKPKATVPELQPPPARRGNDPVPDTTDGEEGEEELIPSTDDVDLEIKRPKKTLTAPKKQQTTRPSSKRAGWEEEEEDPNKAAKAKAKRPRVKPLIDDEDDDDFDGSLNDSSDSNPTLTLSLARPPKPRSTSSPKPATTSSPSRAKKPGPSRGGSSSSDERSSNSRRQAEAVKPLRPERLVISGSMTVQELANALGLQETEIIKRLFERGIAVNITETLDFNIIEMVCQDFEVILETEQQKSGAEKPDNIFNEHDLEHLKRRPPVVTIMGHVDHGKTTLLDSIRTTKVAQGEAGGITQHIGAYHVDVEHEGKMQQVVFLDTPGHEAFTAMRARGTRVTDIAILVVAADDGVRPQTIEAISHAKAAGVPIIVAINKIDKEAAQPDRVKQELMEHNLVPEEWGGETIMVPVSAINKENLDLLLEMIILVSEVEDLEANPDRAARGTVIEAHLDKARGPIATLLVQNGTLRVGDIVVAGSALGKVRAMVDDRGEKVDAASPSFAVEILGLREVPAAGDEFEVFESEREASALADVRAQAQRQSRLLQGRISLSTLSARAQEGELKELNIILKGDMQGSVEAIVNALKKLPQKEVQLRLLLAAPGEVTETDIDLATASDAVLIGFNTTLANGARQAADQLGVDIREYNIIYNLLDDVQAAMEGLLEPELVEEALGQAEVRAVFPVGRSKVAGCYIQSGKVVRNCKVRVLRKGNVIHEGILDSLKRMREDAKEVNAGYECGMGLDTFNDWEEGDILEAYRMATKRRTLSV
ncbi:translation initiation factor IF-2 [Lyngbya sp. PCC 8106]|uniref:translation initiation factor IF-2 n=1 Tax=Lyngbya sp. (strain PCC 8106) TaxID=313612 RepID=UPI0000EAC674|nr:translation initiation factor IF-2 [Lyngbya sp. PCC 8106]EAW38424.1 translation initiation factor IF-2 [Lyngbya sp. PCC 8106]